MAWSWESNYSSRFSKNASTFNDNRWISIAIFGPYQRENDMWGIDFIGRTAQSFVASLLEWYSLFVLCNYEIIYRKIEI